MVTDATEQQRWVQKTPGLCAGRLIIYRRMWPSTSAVGQQSTFKPFFFW